MRNKKLADLAKRIAAFERKSDTHTMHMAERQHGLAQAMRLGVELVAGVGVGAVAGYFLDQWAGTMPLFLLIFFFIGALAGFRNMIRTSQQDASGSDSNVESAIQSLDKKED